MSAVSTTPIEHVELNQIYIAHKQRWMAMENYINLSRSFSLAMNNLKAMNLLHWINRYFGWLENLELVLVVFVQ